MNDGATQHSFSFELPQLKSQLLQRFIKLAHIHWKFLNKKDENLFFHSVLNYLQFGSD